LSIEVLVDFLQKEKNGFGNFCEKNWNIQVWYIQPRGSVWVNTN